MKNGTLQLGVALMATSALFTSFLVADDKSAPKEQAAALEEMMKKAEAATTPGSAHKALEPLVGEWTAQVKFWMDPSTPPSTTKGTSKSTWVLNGRFVQQEFTGDFMGKPFRGIGFTGYDNVRQKYSALWMDDMSTTTVVSEGEASADGKVLTFEGAYACAMTGDKHKASKQVYRILGRDKHVFEMHDPALGDNSKMMEITYTRRGK